MNNRKLIFIGIAGIIYGGLFFPFYTEFLEFGQTLAGHVGYSNFNTYYKSRDISPSLLFVLAKMIAQTFKNIDLANVFVSCFVSLLSFLSTFLFAEKFFPKGQYNLLFPIGMASLFFPNYFLYPLWFPTNFFTWGQIGFYLFLGIISLPTKSILLKSASVFIVTLCHPIYGALGCSYYIFEYYYNKKIKPRKILIIITSLIASVLLITSDYTSNYLKQNKVEITINLDHQETKAVINKLDNKIDSSSIIIKNDKIDMSNIHSPLYHGNEKNFFYGLLSILVFPLLIWIIIKKNITISNNLLCLNYYLLSILLLSISVSLISYFKTDNLYLNRVFSLVDRAAPNRVLNCYFLIFLLIILNKLNINNDGIKNCFLKIFKYSFLCLFVLPIPVYVAPYFWHKPYPSIISLTIISATFLYLTIFFIEITYKKDIKNKFLIFSENLNDFFLNNIYKFSFMLLLIIFFSSILLKKYDFGIEPKYFVNNFIKKNDLQETLRKFPKKGGILVSYGVHGIRGMNVQQISGVEYILPNHNLPKYFFKKKLKSIGCYENNQLTNWYNIRDKMKICFENKSKAEWSVIFKSYNLSGILVPSHYKLNLKSLSTDNIFSLYVNT